VRTALAAAALAAAFACGYHCPRPSTPGGECPPELARLAAVCDREAGLAAGRAKGGGPDWAVRQQLALADTWARLAEDARTATAKARERLRAAGGR
jgi:hypothetical protein